jgi:ABC-type Fe3+ transport system permease subunit
MKGRRRFARLGRAACGLFASALAAALVLTAALDTDPRGGPRASLFPAALALLDPTLWSCLGRSVLVAGLVAAGSVLLGSLLAQSIMRWRFWMRRPLAALACATIAVPPMITALGLRRVFGPENLFPGASATAIGPGGAWLALIWAGLVRGVPLVALVASQALHRIDPVWEDAGRAVGASSFGIGWNLVRPLIRGAVARGAAAVFGLTLLDPGAPLILDLRRTLGYQLVLGTSGGEASRTAVLAILGALLALAALALARLAGPDIRIERPRHRPRAASWRRAPWLVGLLVAWLVFATLPLASLLRDLAPVQAGSHLGTLGALIGPPARQALRDSCVLGVLVATLGLIAARLAGPVRQRAASPWGAPAAVLVVPLAVALASWPIPLRAAVAWGLPTWLGRAALLIDPLTAPGVALTIALVAAWSPALGAALAAARDRWRPESADAAIALGASRRRAWFDLALPRLAPPLARAWVLVACCAGCDASATLLLAPTSRFRPIGPAILAAWSDPAGTPTALTLTAVAAIVSLLTASLTLPTDRD